ncbi:MAG TPA: helix-turn-helix transcriptional regulator [Bacteroidales bacterium]|nr:helix-turn-helix transcriptional regulator [Bacteroidales bacterium]
MQFGKHIRELRIQRKLLQKHVAAALDIDTPMLSKIERGDRKASRAHVILLAKFFKINENELLSLWLGEKVYDVLKGEKVAFKAMDFAEEKLKTKNKKK